MIHLDTSFLVRALAVGTPQDRTLRAWLAAEEPLGMSAVAWAEFLCGPVDPAGLDMVARIVPERVPFGEDDAALAARLFNESGRRRGSLADCMIAASAIRGAAALATENPRDFRRFETAGLSLAADPLAGLLTGEPVAAYGDFRSARTLLSKSLPRSGTSRGAIRR